MKARIIFGKVLRNLRREKGLTQEKLAEKAGINEKYFGELERTNHSPTLDKVFDICNALEIETSKFIEKIENYPK